MTHLCAEALARESLRQATLPRKLSDPEVFLNPHARSEGRIGELFLLRRVFDALRHTQEPVRAYEEILRAVMAATNAESCSFLLMDRDREPLDFGAGESGSWCILDSEGSFSITPARRSEEAEYADVASDSRLAVTGRWMGAVGSLLCVPLWREDEVIGILNLSHSVPDSFSVEDERFVKQVSETLAIALNHLRVYEQSIEANRRLDERVKQAADERDQARQRVAHEAQERRKVHQQLSRMQRMVLVGELSAGIGHNLNNILTGISVPAQILTGALRDPLLARHAEMILRSSERAADLVARLDPCRCKEEEAARKAVPVNDVIQEVVSTARPRWKDEPESRGVHIRGTRSGLYDMLLNLLANAVDAMPGGGTVTFATEVIDQEVQVIVEDDGVGMDEGTLKRIFEPFYTTKGDAGHGLGLATFSETVSAWGGSTEVGSERGEGTQFVLTFPICAEIPAEEEKEALEIYRRGRVLVVDDESDVCDLLSTVLSGDHDVVLARTGEEALTRFEPGLFDVVIADLSLPGISGHDLAVKLQKRDALAAFILTTGWKLNGDDPLLQPFDFWLQKPFKGLDHLRTMVVRGIRLKDARERDSGEPKEGIQEG